MRHIDWGDIQRANEIIPPYTTKTKRLGASCYFSSSVVMDLTCSYIPTIIFPLEQALGLPQAEITAVVQ